MNVVVTDTGPPLPLCPPCGGDFDELIMNGTRGNDNGSGLPGDLPAIQIGDFRALHGGAEQVLYPPGNGLEFVDANGQQGDDVVVDGGASIALDLQGGAGNDRLAGGSGPDDLSGDEFNFCAGPPCAPPPAGDDVLHGGAGDDFLSSSGGYDNVDDQGGADFYSVGLGQPMVVNVVDSGPPAPPCPPFMFPCVEQDSLAIDGRETTSSTPAGRRGR